MAEIFIGSEALASETLTRGQLRWNYRSIFPGVYVPKTAPPSLSQHTLGAWLWSRRRGVIAGLAAAALHGALWVDEAAAIELIWRCGRPPPGIVVRNERIEADEITEIGGLPVTTPERTALDLARHLPRASAVRRLDALARATGVCASDVLPLVDRYPRARGRRRSIVALDLMDGGSQSPKETLIRLALIDAGFPRPRTQIRITDGCATGFIAMGFDKPMVAVVVDRASAELSDRLGWISIHAAAEHTLPLIVQRVGMACSERGYPRWRLLAESTTQRNPMCVVALSCDCGERAAAR